MTKFKKLEKLIDILFKYFKENIIMPCIYKNPKYPHKDNQWTWDMARKKNNEFIGNVAILLKTLIVLDFDNNDLADKYEEKFPVLKTCPSVRTKKGRHYYFKRTPLCNLYALYDHSRCFGSKADEIDFKTICSTGTAGVVIVPPSKDKEWIRSLWDTKIPEFKDDIFDYFVENWVDKKYKNLPTNTKEDVGKEKILDTDIGEEYFDKVDIDDEQINKINKLVESLDVKRSVSWNTWIETCWCLKNISAGFFDRNNIFKSIFINFSKRCTDKFNKEQSLRLWNNTVPRKNGFNYPSLIKWNREDNPDKYVDIDDDSSKTIKKFIAESYNYGNRKISAINIATYDSNKYFIVNIDDTFCKITHDYHETKTIYIVVGVRSAKEKCHDCKDKFVNEINYDKFPDDLKDIVQYYLITITTPEQGLKDFVDTIDDVNIAPMSKEYVSSPEKVNMVGKIFDIHNNTYCPHHPQSFDDQCRCCAMVSNDGKFGIMCNKVPYKYYPETGIIIPIDKLQIINNNITNNINTTNNYLSDNDEIYSDLFNEYYNIFEDIELNKLINISLKGYASDIAKIFYYLAGNKFGVYGNKDDIWWAWDDLEQRWIESKNKAYRFCDKYIAEKFETVIEWFKKNTENDDLRKKRIYKIESIIKRLKDKDQNSILSQTAIIYKDEDRYFDDSLDDDKDILNFQGDVYDFINLKFRNVSCEDRVTKSVGYKVPDVDIVKQSKIINFLKSIMENDVQLEYLLIWLASCLDGWNRDENFHILKGSGRNGKGVLRDLMAEALGNNSKGYFGTIVSSMLTKERPSSDKPIPDLLHIKGKRLIIASEPEKSTKINNGFLKFLTGNDPINGRWLNSNNEINFQPQHSLGLLCNDVPRLDSNDEAIWDRSRIIEFPYKFVSNPKRDNQKTINKNLKTDMKGLGPQFMLIILKYYVKYKKYGLEPTPEILKATFDLRKENNYYAEFVEKFLEKTMDKNDRISQKDINDICRNWITKWHKDLKFSTTDLKDEIENNFGKMKKSTIDDTNTKGWTNINWITRDINN